MIDLFCHIFRSKIDDFQQKWLLFTVTWSGFFTKPVVHSSYISTTVSLNAIDLYRKKLVYFIFMQFMHWTHQQQAITLYVYMLNMSINASTWTKPTIKT